MVHELTYLQKMFEKTWLQILARDTYAYICVCVYAYVSLARICVYFWRSLPLRSFTETGNLEVLRTTELTRAIQTET